MLRKFIESQFKKGLQKQVGRNAANEIMIEYVRVYDANKHVLLDKATMLNMVITSMTLATYTYLKKQSMDEERIRSIIRYVLVEHTQKRQQFVMKFLLRVWSDPFKKIVNISKSKQEKMYGTINFTHEIVRDDDKLFEHHVTKCFFFNFFQANGVPELTSVLCEMDNVWGDLLKDGKYGVAFERPALISAGAPACHFIFKKMNNS